MKPTDIKEVWNLIRPKLEALRLAGGYDWIPEDIYADCAYGGAFLFWEESGFVVVKPSSDGRGDHLLVWIACGEGRNLVESHSQELDRIAKDHGYDRMVMHSHRKGWHRTHGWTHKYSTFERSVP